MSFIDDVRKVYGEEVVQDYLRKLCLRTYDIPPQPFFTGGNLSRLPKVEEYTKPDGIKAKRFASDFGIVYSLDHAEDPDKLNIQVRRKFNIKFNFKD